MVISPYQEGVVAAKSGYEAAHNPYVPGTDMHGLWGDGHVAATLAFDLETGEDDILTAHPEIID